LVKTGLTTRYVDVDSIAENVNDGRARSDIECRFGFFFASRNDGHAVVETSVACPRMRSSDTAVQASLRTGGRRF